MKYAYESSAKAGSVDEAIRATPLKEFLDGVYSDGATLVVVATVDLDAQQKTDLDAIVNGDTGGDASHDVIAKARAFGTALFDEYQEIVTREGIEQSDTAHSFAVALERATQFAEHGYLRAAERELGNIAPVDEVFLTQDRIDEIRNRVRDYLGLEPV